jgi:hypothetical protein
MPAVGAALPPPNNAVGIRPSMSRHRTDVLKAEFLGLVWRQDRLMSRIVNLSEINNGSSLVGAADLQCMSTSSGP